MRRRLDIGASLIASPPVLFLAMRDFADDATRNVLRSVRTPQLLL